MKEITLSLAHYKAMQADHGAKLALETLLSDIQSHVADIQRDDSLPIEVAFFGPTLKGEQSAIVMAIAPAAWKEGQKGFRTNPVRYGLGENEHKAIEGLFNILINPQVSPVIPPEALEDKKDEPAHEGHEEVIGLLVGSHSEPSALVRFEP